MGDDSIVWSSIGFVQGLLKQAFFLTSATTYAFIRVCASYFLSSVGNRVACRATSVFCFAMYVSVSLLVYYYLCRLEYRSAYEAIGYQRYFVGL